MGNTPSAEAPRRAPNKLSKPRVGNPAASRTDLLSPAAPSAASTTGRFSNSYLVGSLPVAPIDPSNIDTIDDTAAEAAVPGEAGEADPRLARRLSRRDSNRLSGLFRSKSSNSEAGVKRRSVGMTDGISRANSVATTAGIQPLTRAESSQTAGNRGSIHYDLSSYEARQLLDLPNESPQVPPLPDSTNNIDCQEVTENTWRSTPVQPAASAPISRVNSELSLYAPTRRRSMAQTPGVATRSPPSFQVSAKSSFRNSHPPTPSDSRRSSFEANARRHLSMPPPPRPAELDSPKRVATPCEADYKQLGGMRFGSLRIMNGTPTSSLGGEQDVDWRRTETPDELTGQPDFPWTTSASPFTGPDSEREAETPGTLRIVQPKPTPLQAVSPIVTTFASELGGGQESRVDEPSPLTTQPQYGDLQTTSKLTEHDDNLFDEDGDASGGSSPETYDLADATITKYDAEYRPKAVQRVVTADSGFFAPSTDSSRKTLSKVDSGYSSINSLRSLRGSNRKQKQEEQLPRTSEHGVSDTEQVSPPEDASIGPLSQVTPPLPNGTMTPSSAPTTRMDMERESEPPYSGVSPSSKAPDNGGSQVNDERAAHHARSNSVDDAESPALSEPSVSRQSSGKSTGKRGKLRRLLSGASRKSLPTGYASHDVNESVPAIPSDVKEKLLEHNGKFPTAPKRLALRVGASKETLKTIVSVESFSVAPADVPAAEEPPQEVVRQPSVKSQRRRSYQTVSSSIAHAATTFLPLRKSLPAVKNSTRVDVDDDGPDGFHAAEIHVPGMESIRHIMGNSAFDQAFTAMHDDEAVHFSANMGASHGRPPYMHHTSSKPARALKTVASAPDLCDTESDMLGPLMPSQRRDKAPPVSMRTRSSKNLRAPPPSRSARSHMAGNGMPAPNGGRPPRPQLRGPTPQPHGQTVHGPPATGGQRPSQHRISHDGQGFAQVRPPPIHPMPSQEDGMNEQWREQNLHAPKPRNQHDGSRHSNRRHTTGGGPQGQKAPYRVLHSYNSPAYRGVPIWG